MLQFLINLIPALGASRYIIIEIYVQKSFIQISSLPPDNVCFSKLTCLEVSKIQKYKAYINLLEVDCCGLPAGGVCGGAWAGSSARAGFEY